VAGSFKKSNPMLLELKPIEETPNSTVSSLHVDGVFCCFILEDGYRAIKVAGETRIPAGVYSIVQRKVGTFFNRYSKKFGHFFVPEIIGIANFLYILFHMGNTTKDTRGCLLCGMAIEYDEATGNYFIPAGRSTSAYLKLYRLLSAAFNRGEAVQIVVDRKERIAA
jgi:hypothetical protein